jgi:hypothetical protein
LQTQLDASALQVVWLADGLDSDDARAFAEGLQGLAGGQASVQVIQTPAPTSGLAVSPPSLQDGGFKSPSGGLDGWHRTGAGAHPGRQRPIAG